jgi:hypothetical protein
MIGRTVSGSLMAKSRTNYRTVIASPDAGIEFGTPASVSASEVTATVNRQRGALRE